MNDSNSKKTFVKICGITSLEDALTAVEFGSDALGFNFVSSSKRKVTAELVKSIVEELPKEIMTVGVFQDFKIEELLKLVEDIGLNAAQMHGSESFEECQFIAERVPVTIKALNPNSPELSNFLDFGVDYLLLDSLTPGEGKRFNWEVDTDFLFKERMFLAGGLNVENVQEGIEKFDPFAVDVASGVESKPGIKDPNLVRRFISAAKSGEDKKF